MVAIVTIAIFSSCVPVENRDLELPLGVWRSAEPSITLYVLPEYQSALLTTNHFLGIYTVEQEEIKMVVSLDRRSGAMRLERDASYDFERNARDLAGTLFRGAIDILKNEMHFILDSKTQEQTGYEVIVFQRWEDYDPIDPADWFSMPETPE